MLEKEVEVSRAYIYVNGFLIKQVVICFGKNEKSEDVELLSTFITLAIDDEKDYFISFN